MREHGGHATAADDRHGLSTTFRHHLLGFRRGGRVAGQRGSDPPDQRAGSKKPAADRCSYDRRMPVTISSMFIAVQDPDIALGFYRDALGLEVRNDVTAGDFRWVTVGSPEQDVDIVLFQPHGGRSQAEGDALLSLVVQGSLQAAIFRSDDLDATFEKVRASGAEVLQEPANQPWGVRDCAFRDPSGNLVRIAQA
jgi:catechol 2,3-dioxygenase-like lactoylglutathione lyase family enzyme